MTDLHRTPLYDMNLALGGRMVPFAGYEMPVQYALGVMKEHLHTRASAGLFDVSHMGQVILTAPGGYAEVASAMESLVPVDLSGLGDGRQRYGFFTNDTGGIEDDLMMARRGDAMFVVINAARKAADIARMQAGLTGCTVEVITDRALIALQGPKAEAVLDALIPGMASMRFMDVTRCASEFGELWISRSGYTGEDGYEISVPAGRAEALARALLEDELVAPVGLGARDTLRLEAGLCLYGNDIDGSTSPVEAGLGWAIQKVRRTGGARAGGFPGAERILSELETGPVCHRVGLSPQGRAPMRDGVRLFHLEDSTDPIGTITSGAFGPTVGGPVAMGYVSSDLASPGTVIYGELRGRRQPVEVVTLPFVAAGYKR